MPAPYRFSAVFKTASALALGLLIPAGAEGADQTPIPNFSSITDGWIAINSDFVKVDGSPSPVVFDPKFPFRRNDEPGQATYRVADLDNPNLKPWVIEELKRYNAKVFAEIGRAHV